MFRRGLFGHVYEGLQTSRQGGDIQLADILEMPVKPSWQRRVEIPEIFRHDFYPVAFDDDGRERLVKVPGTPDGDQGSTIGQDFRPGKW